MTAIAKAATPAVAAAFASEFAVLLDHAKAPHQPAGALGDAEADELRKELIKSGLQSAARSVKAKARAAAAEAADEE